MGLGSGSGGLALGILSLWKFGRQHHDLRGLLGPCRIQFYIVVIRNPKKDST